MTEEKIPTSSERDEPEETAAAIEEGYGLLAECDDAEEWFEELRKERQRDDERGKDWFKS